MRSRRVRISIALSTQSTQNHLKDISIHNPWQLKPPKSFPNFQEDHTLWLDHSTAGMLSATPARQRTSLSRSRPPPSVRSRATPRSNRRAAEAPEDTEEPELPEYQPPEAPLSAEAHRQLHQLSEKQYFETMQKHIHDAGVQITYSAGEVSDRLRDAQTRYEKAKEKRRAEQEGQDQDAESEDEEYQRLAEQERQVNSIMGRLEEKMRSVVESDAKYIGLKDALDTLDKEEARAQTVLLGERQLRSHRRATRRTGNEEEEEEQEDEEERESTPVRELREHNTENPPTQRLNTSLVEGQKKWEELSLTQRYVLNLFSLSVCLTARMIQIRQQQCLYWVLPRRA